MQFILVLFLLKHVYTFTFTVNVANFIALGVHFNTKIRASDTKRHSNLKNGKKTDNDIYKKKKNFKTIKNK